MINTYFGGKLIQDDLFHPQSNGRYMSGHAISRKPYDEYDKKTNKHMLEVNSHHHQCVTLDNLSKNLKPLWYAESSDTVEVFEHEELPISGVQYHPEEWFDSLSDTMIKTLLNGN